MKHKTEVIRKLNDLARTTGRGVEFMTTPKVYVMPFLDYVAIIGLMKAHDDFTEDNDPHGEHDFGSFYYRGRNYLWKFDYYDLNREFASPDPSDPKVTRRVLTLMDACEY